MAGLVVTKQHSDEMAGTTARDVRLAFERVRDYKRWLDATPDADLTALGYDGIEIANLRSAYGDLDELRQIFEGTQDLPSAKDFRTFARRLWGLGVKHTGQA